MISLARKTGCAWPGGDAPVCRLAGTGDLPPTSATSNIVEDMQLVRLSQPDFRLARARWREDRETAIHLMNHARYFVPHILALSTNSPFWLGMNTGLKSYRCKVFDKFPRTNIPDYFQSYGRVRQLHQLLIKTGCIDNAKKILRDIRPHPFFDTLRVSDL